MDTNVSRRNALKAGGAALAGIGISGALKPQTTQAQVQATPAERPIEWRNRQSGMSYRKLGRTGYMVSEIIMGGNTISVTNNEHVREAVDLGLNYFDTSPAYGNGRSEEGYGALFKDNSSFRERVFMNSKVSVFDSNRGSFYRGLYNELSDADKLKIDAEIEDTIARRGIMDSEYLGRYGSWQLSEITNAYRSNVMEKYYGDKIDRKAEYYDRIIASVEASLTRLNTDYLDNFMCPHGANSPEELLIPEVYDAMNKLKQDGKIRAFGLSAHTDPASILYTAVRTNFFDTAQVAYSVTNGQFSMSAVRECYEHGLGVIAMKAAKPVYPGSANVWVPPSRLDRLNHMIPGNMKTPMKAYLWALQNPNLVCVNSEMINAEHMRENLTLAGMKVDLIPEEDPTQFSY